MGKTSARLLGGYSSSCRITDELWNITSAFYLYSAPGPAEVTRTTGTSPSWALVATLRPDSKHKTMGFFDFLKRNKRSKTETVMTSKPSPEQTLFADKVLEIITPTVEKFGFQTYRTETEEYFTTIIFRKDKQYIKISGSTYPTDYPYSYNVILGEGDSEDVYEWDWNSIALWRLKTKIDPKSNAKEFEFPHGDKVNLSISKANEELLKYADTFLHGDLTLFYETRSEQNKDREPYKIYTPDKDGNYKTTDEQPSVEQKKKYS